MVWVTRMHERTTPVAEQARGPLPPDLGTALAIVAEGSAAIGLASQQLAGLPPAERLDALVGNRGRDWQWRVWRPDEDTRSCANAVFVVAGSELRGSRESLFACTCISGLTRLDDRPTSERCRTYVLGRESVMARLLRCKVGLVRCSDERERRCSGEMSARCE